MSSTNKDRRKRRKIKRRLAARRGDNGQASQQKDQRLPGRISAADLESRNQLIQANLGLVHRVARQYVHRGLTFDDLIGEGNLGLIRAAEDYDPSIGTRFSTYATHWIREAIVSGLANTGTTIRLPMNVSKLLGRWRRTERALGHARGHAPTFEEVAAAMELDRTTQRLVVLAHCVSQLEKADMDREDDTSLSPMMYEGGITPEDILTAVEEQESVSRWVAGLNRTERTVVWLRFGLTGKRPMSFERIGERLGLAPSVVERTVSLVMQRLDHVRETCAVEQGPTYGFRVG